MGRPAIELDELLQKRIVQVVERGGTRVAAALAAGVDRATLLRWLAKGRKGDERYRDFCDRIRRAEAVAEIEMSDALFTAAKDDARYALEWLSRRRSKSWAKRDHVAAKTTEAGRELAALSAEQLQHRFAETIAQAMDDEVLAAKVLAKVSERKGAA